MSGESATSVGGGSGTTEVGSVFVSNYPPYSAWSADANDQVQRALDTAPAAGVQLGLYLHIPFCRKRCKFCYFRVYTDKNAAAVQRYVDALAREAALYARRAAVAARPVKLVYFGGGTPSYISSKHLRQVFDTLRERFDLGAVDEITFECEPGTLTRQKLAALRELGVTRLSLGVENFDDEILQENGRAHLTEEIRRVVPWIHELGFPQLNVDLIAGMIGETDETWDRTVERTLELDPDSVTIYQLELPYNTVYSRRLLDGREIPVADWETKRAWHDRAFARFEQAGYRVSSAYTVVKKDGGAGFLYRDNLWQGNDLLGLGVSSFSHVGGVHFQNSAGWDPYLERIEGGELPVDRAYATRPQDRLIRELILQLKLGRLDTGYFSEKFDVDVLTEFRDAFDGLERRGMLRKENGRVRLERNGLLRVDQLLPEFYAPEFRNLRYT
jgi:oxygen-independent coproporphyrinogen-3 oxidase